MAYIYTHMNESKSKNLGGLFKAEGWSTHILFIPTDCQFNDIAVALQFGISYISSFED